MEKDSDYVFSPYELATLFVICSYVDGGHTDIMDNANAAAFRSDFNEIKKEDRASTVSTMSTYKNSHNV